MLAAPVHRLGPFHGRRRPALLPSSELHLPPARGALWGLAARSRMLPVRDGERGATDL